MTKTKLAVACRPRQRKENIYISMGVAACAPPDGKLECGEEILDGIVPAVILIRNTAVVASGGVLRLPAASGTGIR